MAGTNDLALFGNLILCTVLAAYGVFVLISGWAPRRGLAPFRSVRAYGLHCLQLSAAFACIALSQAVPPGPYTLLFSVAGFGILFWLTWRTWPYLRTVRWGRSDPCCRQQERCRHMSS
ncbi:hypothetical protein GCM10027290_24450 [Micromonospora sonneratiae]